MAASPRLAGVLLAATNAALRGGTLVAKMGLALWMARVLGPHDMGIYGLMAAALAIAVFGVGLEYHYFTMREVASRPAPQQAAVLRDQLVVHGFAYAVVAVMLLLAPLGLLGDLPLRWFVPLLLLEHLSQEAYCALNALSRPLAANLTLFTRNAAWIPPVVLLAGREHGIDRVFLGWTIGVAASLLIAAWSLRGIGWRTALRARPDWAEIRRGLRVAAPFIVMTGSSMGMLFLDRFVIDAWQGAAAVGVYTFFAGIATAITTLTNAGVTSIRLPRFISTFRNGTREAFDREVRTAWLLTIGGAALLAGAAAVVTLPMLRFVGRASYSEALPVFWILLGAAIVRSAAEVPLYALYAQSRDRALLVVNLLGVGAALGANLLLVPRFGIRGAALAALGGALVVLASTAVARARADRMAHP